MKGLPRAHHIDDMPEGFRIQARRGSLGVVEGYSLVYQTADQPDRPQYIGLPSDAEAVRKIGEALLKLAAKLETALRKW